MKELKETIALMQSDDYKERFAAEYYQLETRYLKLVDMIDKYKKGTLNFTPNCPRSILSRQANRMKQYIKVLLERANVEKITLDTDPAIKTFTEYYKYASNNED